jgi:hypothetical protein
VAWAQAVTVGNEPMNPLRNTSDLFMSPLRNGHEYFQCVRTFHPPPSMTNVTTTLGGVPGPVMPGIDTPSWVVKSNPIIRAVVGARSASVTISSRVSGFVMMPGAYTTVGTRSR